MPAPESATEYKALNSLSELEGLVALSPDVLENVKRYKRLAIITNCLNQAEDLYRQRSGGIMAGWGKVAKRFGESGAIANPGMVRVVVINSELNPSPHTEFVLTHEATELALQKQDEFCENALNGIGLLEIANAVPTGTEPLYPHYVALIHEYLQAEKAGLLEVHHKFYEGKDLDPSGARFREKVFELIKSKRVGG